MPTSIQLHVLCRAHRSSSRVHDLLEKHFSSDQEFVEESVIFLSFYLSVKKPIYLYSYLSIYLYNNPSIILLYNFLLFTWFEEAYSMALSLLDAASCLWEMSAMISSLDRELLFQLLSKPWSPQIDLSERLRERRGETDLGMRSNLDT